MAAVSSIIAGIGVGLAAVGTAGSLYSGYKASREQKKARQAQQRQQNLQYRRSQVSNLRQAQLAAARSQVQAGAVGSLGGSGFAGGRAGLGAGFGSASGYASQLSGLSNDISVYQQRAANYQGLGNIFGAVGSFGQQLYSYGSSFNQTPNPPPQQIQPQFGSGDLSYGFAGK